MDALETQDRQYLFAHFAQDAALLKEASQLYYGYYFFVLQDRMESAMAGGEARKLYIQVRG